MEMQDSAHAACLAELQDALVAVEVFPVEPDHSNEAQNSFLRAYFAHELAVVGTGLATVEKRLLTKALEVSALHCPLWWIQSEPSPEPMPLPAPGNLKSTFVTVRLLSGDLAYSGELPAETCAEALARAVEAVLGDRDFVALVVGDRTLAPWDPVGCGELVAVVDAGPPAVRRLCHAALCVLEKQSWDQPGRKLAQLKTRGDLFNVIARTSKCGTARAEAIAAAHVAYQEAHKYACGIDDGDYGPIYLGLAVNFSVFCVELLVEPEEGMKKARYAFEDAISELDIPLAQCDPRIKWPLQQLRKNLVNWTEDS